MSLRLRLAVAFGLVVALGIGVASLAAYKSTETELRAEIDDFLRTRATEITEGSRAIPGPDGPGGRRDGRGGGNGDGGDGDGGGREGDGAQIDDFIDTVFAFDPDSVIQVINHEGVVIGRQGGSLPVDAIDLAIAAAPSPSVTRDLTGDETEFRMITRHFDAIGAVQVARDLDETEAVLARLRANSALIGIGMTLLAALAGWLVARALTKPLRRLADTAHAIAATQDLSTPIPVTGRDEVGRLAESLDTMIDALATSRDQQHRLVMDAGHELRTPLTSLRTNAELLARAPDLDEDRRAEVISGITSEVTELSSLVTELVELATDTHDDLPVGPVVLADVVHSAVERLGRRSDRPVTIAVDNSIVMGREPMLDRALANLLGNADKFAPPGLPVEVTVTAGRVRVRDRGPGIDAADLSHVFGRFYRATSTRTEPGSGLGLAIVAQIVARHGGSVVAANATDGSGAIVGFDLPLADDEARE